MTFGSVRTGIGAEMVAFRSLGWEAAFVSEIAPFPCTVLAHHYPEVPNLGDLTKIKTDRNVDVLFGGTPCQGFSIGGFRRGLDDDRSNLALGFLGLARELRPRWLAWENVPGVLQANRGRDFGAFLGCLAELGYGWAYRVLDAQYFGTPQKRRRLFLVAYSGDWRLPGAVLFERPGLSRYPDEVHTERESDTKKVNGYPDIDIYHDTGRSRFVTGFGTLTARDYKDGYTSGLVIAAGKIRRLTPIEHERLMGLPDNYTKVNEKVADSIRYKHIGNSIHVGVLVWIARRIEIADRMREVVEPSSPSRKGAKHADTEGTGTTVPA